MEDQDFNRISPIGYLRILFRRKWFIVLPMFTGLILGICAGMLLPKKYQSNTVILVEEGKTDNPLFSKIAISTTVSQRLANIKESMLGWISMVKLVKKLKLDKTVKNQYEFEQLIFGLQRNTIIRLRGPNIIDLAHFGSDPNETQAIVKAITEIFIERNIETQNRETSDAIKFIDEQLKVYRGKIKSAEIAQLQEKLDVLLVDSTEEHPTVKKIREQVNSKKKELKNSNLEYTEDAVLSTEATSPLIDDIRKALDGLQNKIQPSAYDVAGKEGASDDLYKLVLIDKLDNVMGRDVRVNEEIYNMLLQRLETAKITQRLQSSKEGTRYTITTPPRLPLNPIKPNKPLVILAGLFCGAIAGVGLVFMREFLDKSFLDVQDAKDFFGQPLLGAISSITTTDVVIQRKIKERWMIGIMAIAGITAIIISSFISGILN